MGSQVCSRASWIGALGPRAEVELDCDAVVVGSGAGGAVVAAELAEGGLDVVVVEEGGHHTTEEFEPRPTKMIRTLYRSGGAQLAWGVPPIQFAEGRCVGGSTVINGGMTFRPPEKILDRWRREEGLDLGDMDAVFARVERRLSATQQDPGTVGRDNELLKHGADVLGWKVVPNIRSQLHCAGANNCAFGCPTRAKRSTLVSYLPRAMAFGARVLADCRVDRVLLRGRRAIGVTGHLVGDRRRLRIHARIVVVSAGALQTPALLHRSGIRPRALGRGLALHPNVKVVAVFDDLVEGWKGAHQAFQVRQFQDEGIVLAAINLPPGLVAMTLPYYGARLGDVMEDYARMVIGGVLVEDSGRGRVFTTPGGHPVARYDVSRADAAKLVKGVARLAELLFAAGARRIHLPFAGVPPLLSADQARALPNTDVPRSALELVTFHLMGTAAMGGDPRRHVCDSAGRVRDTEGLHVADASLFPTPIGVNPMETIMGLATRNAARILDGWHA